MLLPQVIRSALGLFAIVTVILDLERLAGTAATMQPRAVSRYLVVYMHVGSSWKCLDVKLVR